MIEVAAALSMASSAYKAIRTAIETGREAQDMIEVFGRFFDAKDAMAEANAKAETSSLTGKLFAGSSVEAEALQSTAAKFKIRQLEKELYEFLVYTGQSDFYEEMMRERRIIRQRRFEAAQAAAQKRANMIDLIAVIGGLLVVTGVIVGMISLVSSAG